jgi:hypothetical protein
MKKTKKRRKPDVGSMGCSTVRTVYRVQDRDGRGPWRPGFSMQWVEDRPKSEYAQLRPIMLEFPDLLDRLRDGFHFGVGCTSLEKLRRWITKSEWQTLRKFGFRCFAIEPDKIVAESDIQCVFESRQPLKKHKKRVRLHP